MFGYKLVAHAAPSTLDQVDGLVFYSGKEASRDPWGEINRGGMNQGGRMQLVCGVVGG